MKVNMNLLEDKDAGVADDAGSTDEEPAKGHPKMKAFVLVACMAGGFALFVWNMTGFVNNMRLDNQGHASSAVYEMQDLENFRTDGSKGSGAIPISEDAEGGLPDETDKDAAIDEDAAENDMPKTDEGHSAPEDGEDENVLDGTGDVVSIEALQKEAQDARNKAALMEQELKNAKDMLDSSLAREIELQKQLSELSGTP